MILRTPDERFADLPGWPFVPRYVELPDVPRMHYVDEGSGPVVLCLHAIGHGIGKRTLPP